MYSLTSAGQNKYKKEDQILVPLFYIFWLLILFLFRKAKTLWQWMNYTIASLPANKKPLLINFDESSILWFYGQERGHVLTKKRKHTMGNNAAIRASRKEMRGAMTYACFVCDQSDIQPHLPQILVSNKRLILKREVNQIETLLPKNVFLVRRETGWNTNELMAAMIKLLQKAVAPYLDAFVPILIMDTARCHSHRRVILTCNALNFPLLFIPAKTTWLLQPLDTHAFGPFKNCLKRKYSELQLKDQKSRLSNIDWVSLIVQVIQQVIQGIKWSSAFADNGFGDSQAQVSRRVWKELSFGREDISAEEPTREELLYLFPQRQKVPIQTLLSVARRFQDTAELPPLPSMPDDAKVVRPWLGRTRSTIHILQGSSSESEGDSDKGSVAAATPISLRRQSSSRWRQGSLTRLHLALAHSATPLPLGASPSAALRAKDKGMTTAQAKKNVVDPKGPLQISSRTRSKTFDEKKTK